MNQSVSPGVTACIGMSVLPLIICDPEPQFPSLGNGTNLTGLIEQGIVCSVKCCVSGIILIYFPFSKLKDSGRRKLIQPLDLPLSFLLNPARASGLGSNTRKPTLPKYVPL